jgi:hypothetical protein
MLASRAAGQISTITPSSGSAATRGKHQNLAGPGILKNSQGDYVGDEIKAIGLQLGPERMKPIKNVAAQLGNDERHLVRHKPRDEMHASYRVCAALTLPRSFLRKHCGLWIDWRRRRE